MNIGQHDFEHFMRRREAAARAYVNGDGVPLSEITTVGFPATFFGPRGGVLEGAGPVASTYSRDAANFQPGSETHFEVLHQSAGGNVAYWVGYQHAKVRVAGKPEPVLMTLRVSEIFRLEKDGWKLVHRHADEMAAKAEESKAARA